MTPADYAESMVRSAYELPGETAIRLDVGTLSSEFVRSLVDNALGLCDSHKVRLRGIRTDILGFGKLGVELTTVNAGVYRDVPVVIAPAADFETMEFVFQPRR